MFEWLKNLFRSPMEAKPLEQRSPEWGPQAKIFLRMHPLCVCCGGKAEEVHHYIPFNFDPSLEMVKKFWRPVCRPCHFLKGHNRRWNEMNPYFDADAADERHRIEAHRLKKEDYTPEVRNWLNKKILGGDE